MANKTASTKTATHAQNAPVSASAPAVQEAPQAAPQASFSSDEAAAHAVAAQPASQDIVVAEPAAPVAPVQDPYMDDFETEDSLTFSNSVIEKIVMIACRDVPGVVGMKGGWIDRMQETITGTSRAKGVSVEVMQDNSVRVNISILMAYGAYAPQVFEDVKKAVVAELIGMTGLEVSGINLRIEDVVQPGEEPSAPESEA